MQHGEVVHVRFLLPLHSNYLNSLAFLVGNCVLTIDRSFIYVFCVWVSRPTTHLHLWEAESTNSSFGSTTTLKACYLGLDGKELMKYNCKDICQFLNCYFCFTGERPTQKHVLGIGIAACLFSPFFSSSPSVKVTRWPGATMVMTQKRFLGVKHLQFYRKEMLRCRLEVGEGVPTGCGERRGCGNAETMGNKM